MKVTPTSKLNYCAPTVWRKIYLYQRSPVFKMGEKFFYSRSSTVPLTFAYCNVSIYSGKKWHSRYISPWTVGFKFGELTWNRRLAVYKAKQLRKKKKKKI